MTKLQRILFAISMTVVWGLLMPPYLYGILGIPVTFVFTFLLGKQLPEAKKMLSRMKWYYLIPNVIFCYMFGMEFYDQWHLSSKVIAVANLMGLSVEPFLVLAVVAASVLALPGMCYITCAVCGVSTKRGVTSVGAEFPAKENGGTADTKLYWMDVLFALAVALCLGMRLAFNPWSGVWPENDSSAYLYVGMMLRKGEVLYTDIFEHKGIFLYLIDALGLSITGGSWTGVWILEVLNAFVTALFVFKTAKLFTTKRTVQYITVAASVAALTVCMLLTDGNLSEEWVLPWIMLAVYIFFRYFTQGTYRFYDIILLGISFAFIVFVRANMVAAWIAFLPVIFITMIVRKQWKDLGICIGNFLLGCAVVTVPVVAYTLATGSFADMMKCYFEFSFAYSGKSAMPIPQVMWLLFQRMTVYSVVLVAAGKIFYKNRSYQLNLWLYAVSLVLASMSGRAHAHYAIILIPALVVPMVQLLDCVEGISFQRPLTVLMLLAWGFFAAEFFVSVTMRGEPQRSEVAEYIMEHTSEDDNVFMMGNSCVYYLQSNRTTTNRFFYQTPAINISDELYEEYLQEMEKNKPDLVVLVGDKEKYLEEGDNYAGSILAMDKWCEEGVYTCDEQDGFYAYRLNAGG